MSKLSFPLTLSTTPALDTEGIFRLSASTLEIERLKTLYNCLSQPHFKLTPK